MCKKVKDHSFQRYRKNDWLEKKKGGQGQKRDCEAAFRKCIQNAIKVSFFTEITEVGSHWAQLRSRLTLELLYLPILFESFQKCSPISSQFKVCSVIVPRNLLKYRTSVQPGISWIRIGILTRVQIQKWYITGFLKHWFLLSVDQKDRKLESSRCYQEWTDQHYKHELGRCRRVGRKGHMVRKEKYYDRRARKLVQLKLRRAWEDLCRCSGCSCVCVSCSVVSNSLQSHGLYSLQISPGQITRMGSHFLLPGTFPTKGLNPGLPEFFDSYKNHCRQILYLLSHEGCTCRSY